MDSREIERRLRLPAPDEPAVLPALVLPPSVTSMPRVRVRLRTREATPPTGLLSPRLVLVLLFLILATIAAAVAGAVGLEWVSNPLNPYSGFDDHLVQLEYPSGWVKLTPDDPLNQSGASTVLLLSSVGVDGCAPADVEHLGPPTPIRSGDEEFHPAGGIFSVEDQILACVLERPMAPGEIRLAVTRGLPQQLGIGPIESLEPTAWYGLSAQNGLSHLYVPTIEDGWDRQIDGMPAKLVVTLGSPVVGSDEIRTWAVYEPFNVVDPWFIRAHLRGPDLDRLRRQADDVALSLEFAGRPPELDVAHRDEAIVAAIDQLDRDLRRFPGSRFYGCFSRTPGSRDVVLRDGPGGPLSAPVPATCTTSTAETTLLHLWRLRLTVTWRAGDGYPAGEWNEGLLVGPDGLIGSRFPSESAFAFPGSTGALPPPIVADLAIPVGSLVEVMSPGISQAGSPQESPIQALYAAPDERLLDRLLADALPGTRLFVVGGPYQAIGTDWYLVEYDIGNVGPGDLGWVPAAWNGRPLLKTVDPACPTAEPSIVDLVYLEPAERLLCFGDRELALAPAIAATTDTVGNEAPSGGPAWLDAWATRWRLYGEDGSDGVEPPLTVAISPEQGDSIPTGAWLTVRGHFDDPASAGCRSKYAESSGSLAEWPEFQQLVCRELFVVTGYERRAAP